MKAILFSDIHLGLSKDSPTFHKITLDFADWMVEEATKRGITELICGGDVFHHRKYIHLETNDVAWQFFDKLKDFNLRIITGNHDCFYLDNSFIHSMKLLTEWENITIYDNAPHYENIAGTTVGFMPWGTDVDEMQKCDVMFGHFEITGFQMGPAMICKKGMSATDLIKKSPLVISGHFHKPQTNEYKNGKIVYMGSPFQHNWGEKNQDKFIYELDFSDSTLTPIENTVSPKHLEIETKADVKKAAGNIIRVLTDDENSAIVKQLSDKVPLSMDVIVEDKEIKKAAETIKDFKGVDIKSGFEEVVDVLEGVTKDLKSKILATSIDYMEKAKQEI